MARATPVPVSHFSRSIVVLVGEVFSYATTLSAITVCPGSRSAPLASLHSSARTAAISVTSAIPVAVAVAVAVTGLAIVPCSASWLLVVSGGCNNAATSFFLGLAIVEGFGLLSLSRLGLNLGTLGFPGILGDFDVLLVIFGRHFRRLFRGVF